MKKIGGILVGLLGAGLAVVGVKALIEKGKNEDECVNTTECDEEYYETENADVESTEE